MDVLHGAKSSTTAVAGQRPPPPIFRLSRARECALLHAKSTYPHSAPRRARPHRPSMNTVYHRIDSSSGSVVSLRASGVSYHELAEVCRDSGGRIAVFRNHSKVMAGYGEKFDFAIESSANINTNPRTEQTVVTIDHDVAKFYFDFYDAVISFDKAWR